MGNSFKDQLLKAGLIDTSRARQAKPDKPRNSIQKRRKDASARPGQNPATQQSLAHAAERDRQLNLQRKAEADKKALTAQIRQLIETNRVPSGDGELPYNFTDQGKIRRIFVTEAVHRQIVGGALAIAKIDGRYELVPAAVGGKLRARDAGFVVLCNDPQGAQKDLRASEADHPVPDDLIW